MATYGAYTEKIRPDFEANFLNFQKTLDLPPIGITKSQVSYGPITFTILKNFFQKTHLKKSNFIKIYLIYGLIKSCWARHWMGSLSDFFADSKHT